MNTELLLKVKAAILAEPLKFDMDSWFMESDESPCGTTACIAGHAIAIHQNKKKLKFGISLQARSDIQSIASEIIGLTHDQATCLFGSGHWPEPFERDYDDANTPTERAQIAADRIDFFIATNGTDQESAPAV